MNAKSNWLLFVGVLVAPAVLQFLGTLTGSRRLSDQPERFYGDEILPLAFVVSALICGVWSAVRFSKQAGMRILLSIILVPVFGLLSFFLSLVGCTAGVLLRSSHS